MWKNVVLAVEHGIRNNFNTHRRALSSIPGLLKDTTTCIMLLQWSWMGMKMASGS
jgi:hypothetical protein